MILFPIIHFYHGSDSEEEFKEKTPFVSIRLLCNEPFVARPSFTCKGTVDVIVI